MIPINERFAQFLKIWCLSVALFVVAFGAKELQEYKRYNNIADTPKDTTNLLTSIKKIP
jgi:hypothetical protein